MEPPNVDALWREMAEAGGPPHDSGESGSENYDFLDDLAKDVAGPGNAAELEVPKEQTVLRAVWADPEHNNLIWRSPRGFLRGVRQEASFLSEQQVQSYFVEKCWNDLQPEQIPAEGAAPMQAHRASRKREFCRELLLHSYHDHAGAFVKIAKGMKDAQDVNTPHVLTQLLKTMARNTPSPENTKERSLLYLSRRCAKIRTNICKSVELAEQEEIKAEEIKADPVDPPFLLSPG